MTLYWHEAGNRLTVTVYDAKCCDFFELDAPADRALEVFYHPYAHAALRGIEYGRALDLDTDALHV